MTPQDHAHEVVTQALVAASLAVARDTYAKYERMSTAMKVETYGTGHESVGAAFEKASKFDPEEAVETLSPEIALAGSLIEPATPREPSLNTELTWVGASWYPTPSDSRKRKKLTPTMKSLRKTIHQKMRGTAVADVTKR